ncbi:MAG TPA: SpvB/TcaC N-terminal domain-containing protein, partial [Longimicrobiaceae bacterium]|nr:SpvB/TcaC N-terminal domain-containing protein [Longimicrobiaceae bacterium]
MGTQANASAEAISLPKGGGALQGIGETFSPDLHTGTGNFSVPLSLPAGRGGFQPQLSLTYSTGTGNGPFGLGWSLGVPMVSRKTSKGVPRYRDGDVFILSGSEDLVPVPGAPGGAQRYRPRTEGIFARIDHHAAPDVWEVQGRDGLVSRYGAVQADGTRAVVSSPGGEGKVFAWCLSETVDPHGNRIVYEYERDRGSDDFHHWDQLYLRRVRYADYTDESGETRFLVSVELLYEDRPDPFSDRRAGFEVRTRRRCRRIEVHTHAGEDRLVRSYTLRYLDQCPGGAVVLPRNGVSLLSRVVVTGHDGAHTEQLPPLELGYTRFEPEERRFFPLRGAELPSRSLADGSLELVDLFGSGLPDFLEMDGVVRYWRNLGGGRFDRPRAMRSAPAGVRLDDPGVQLIDANGDGRTDLLVTSGPVAGYYPLAFGGEWDARSFQAYPLAPSFDLRDPEVRLVDLDGDGVTDAIRAGTRLECFFNDPVEGWGETLHVDRGALEGLRGLTFADPRVRLADLDGDGLQDVVLLHGGRVDYWPAEGRGRWGKRVVMKNSPRLPHGYDPRRILLGDVDGDGVADLVYVDDRSVTLWINRTGNGWSDPVVIRGTPRVSDADSARLADLLGSGISGLLWSAEPRSGGDPLHFLDFTGGVKPYLLNHTDNHTGAVKRVEYAPSTRFHLAAEARPETRWKTTLPFPVQVVARTETVDLLSGGKLTTEYTYHHGYWDGEEREFRGFSRVDQRDTEVFGEADAAPEHAYSPPVETRTWFHPGPVANGAGEWTRADFTAEFWSEPFPGGATTSLLPTAAEMGVLLPDLPPRARRDALRALRGQVLRTEVYALDVPEREDRPDRSDRPYTVTERVVGLREVDPPAAGQERSRVFFPHLLAERTTQWERGSDPMTGFSFTGDYDEFGQPRLQLAVAVPRGRDPRSEGEWAESYLATEVATGYAVRGAGGPFLADRVAHVTTREIVGAGTGSVRALWSAVFSGGTSVERRVIAQTLSFYDGEAFQGLPLGQVGSRGALVRSEQLVLTPEIVQQAYGAEVPPCFAGGGADWSGYPEEFRALTAPGAGYVRRQAAAGSPVVAGWYAPTAQREYDFQVSPRGARGLVRRERDALGGDAGFSYDQYRLLPRQVVDAAGLATRAMYSYQVLKPRWIRDANGNRTRIRYSPLGLVRSVATMGKVGEAVGDTETSSSSRFRYDFRAFAERGEPISVRARRRVHYETDLHVPMPERDETVNLVEYSDGFGRLLQTRTQAGDVSFGDEPFGEGVLRLDRRHDAADVVGRGSTPRPRVVVSGWQVYDNKGRVVEKYEPFFSAGWAYAPAAEEEVGRRVVQHFDPRGRVVRTVSPDGSEQRVIQGVPAQLDLGRPAVEPTPWEAYAYDANDNAGRTHPGSSDGFAHHRDTPSSVVVDALGRPVLAVSRSREVIPEGGAVQEHRTRTRYDVQGNVTVVWDTLGREVARTVYDLAGRALRSTRLDAGTAVVVVDASGETLETRDSRGALSLRARDVLRRPIRVWARDGAGEPTTLRERLEYGDGGDRSQDPVAREAARALNQLGRLVRHFDEAGLLAVAEYDFRGMVREKSRHPIRDAELVQAFADAARNHWRVAPFRVEWTPPAGVGPDEHAEAMLDPAGHRTRLEHDALGRLRRMLTPADAAGVAHEVVPAYDRAGALERVVVDGQVYVDRIAYDARGQRTLIAYGNGVMTRHAYHAHTFRLVRARSERYVKPAGGALTYRPAPGPGEGHPLQDLEYAYDLNGHLLSTTERTPGCGVLNNPDAAAWQAADPVLAGLLASGDALVRRFAYDPLGRLLSATGREDAGTPAPRPWHDAPRVGFGSGAHSAPDQENAPTLTALYTETYGYDAAGNLASLSHSGRSGAWTRHFGVGGLSPAAWAAEWPAHAGGEPWPDAPGNRLT